MTTKKIAPPETEDATFGRDRCKGTKNRRKITIPIPALEIMAMCEGDNPFMTALIDISERRFDQTKYNLEAFALAALVAINGETDDFYTKRSKAGAASVEARYHPQALPVIEIPPLWVPPTLKEKTYPGQFHPESFSPMDLLKLRYIMFRRNYSPAEVDICMNEFWVKRPNKGQPISGKDEFWEKAMHWANYGRATRFPKCPEAFDFCIKIMEIATPEVRSHILDRRFAIEFVPSADAEKKARIQITCSKLCRLFIEENGNLFISLVKSKYPNSDVFYSDLKGFF